MRKLLFLSSAILLCALSALADTSYGINVGGVEVKESNKNNVTGGNISSGTVTYNSSSKVLTLSGVTISRKGGDNYGVHNRNVAGLTIRFSGTNNIQSDKANALHLDKATTVEITGGSIVNLKMTDGENAYRGVVYVNGVSAVFKGPGTLTASARYKVGSSSRPVCFEGTGKTSNSTLTFSNINCEGNAYFKCVYKFKNVQVQNGSDLKFVCDNSSEQMSEIGGISFSSGVNVVTPAGATTSQFSESDGVFPKITSMFKSNTYLHITDNYGAIISRANFPDANFLTYMRSLCGSSSNLILTDRKEEYLTKAELQSLTSLNVSGKSISDLTGVGLLTYLKTLNCSSNSLSWLPTLPSSLTSLNCSSNELTSSPTLPSGIQEVYAGSNKFPSLSITGKSYLKTLDVQYCTSLTTLNCYSNALTSLSVSGCSYLKTLNCNNNQLTSLPTLPSSVTSLNCSFNELTASPTLPSGIQEVYAGSNNFTSLSITGMSSLSKLDVQYCTSLTTLNCYRNALTSLNISYCTALKTLKCYSNQLTSLPTLPSSLTSLNCLSNKLTELPSLPSPIEEVYAGRNNFSSLVIWDKPNLKTLSVPDCTSMTALYCFGNALTSLDVSGCTAMKELSCSDNQLTSLGTLPSSLTSLSCANNKLTSLPTLPSGLTLLYSSNNQLTSLPILPTNIEKIILNSNKFTQLTITGKSRLTTLNVSNCTALTSLSCSGNALTTLYVDGCTALKELSCHDNQLTSLDELPSSIRSVYAGGNKFTGLTITGKSYLETLSVPNCTSLESLSCNNNSLTTIDVTECTALKTLNCSRNELSELSVSGCKALIELRCPYNQITGDNMDRLVSSLRPISGGNIGEFYVISEYDEGNEITAEQLATAAFTLNWRPLKYNGAEWVDILQAGDVNIDFAVDVTDVVGIANHVMGATPAIFYEPLADMNGKDGVDITDVVKLANIVMGN